MLLCIHLLILFVFIFSFIKEPLLAKINIYILIFNLLPVYPLDGSKLLLFLSYFIDYQKFHANTNKSFTIVYLYFMDYYETNRGEKLF